jgi:ribose transport system substrate-binding protein
MKKICLNLIIVVMILLHMPTLVTAQGKSRIVVIPKSGTALFWKSVKMGAKLGAIALSDVEISWKAPAAEDNVDEQISLVEQSTTDEVSGILLSPINQNALTGSVAKAMNKKIPVIIFDSALKGVPGKDFICFVGINNRKAGNLAGKHLAGLLHGRGKVVLLRYIKDQANTTEREEGFIDAINNNKNIQLTVKDCYAGGTVDDAKNACKSILNKLQEADGVFCPNEQSTLGMLLTLQETKLTGKVKFIGFDTPPPVINALKKGEISAIIAQDPARIGYLSVKTMIDHIRGKKIPSNVNVDVQVVTKENINNPEIQKLLALPSVTE